MDKSAIEDLEAKIKQAAVAYYNDIPIMSDEEFDQLVDTLREKDPTNTTLKIIGAPLPKNSPLKKAKHDIPMKSQSKVKTEEEFEKWVKKTGAEEFCSTEKMDGISVELKYKDYKLVQALTRGNGLVGEDITHNVRLMQNVAPEFSKDLDIAPNGTLRGEIILRKSTFEKYFDKEEYANPRNTASGISRRKIPHENVEHLEVVYFDCVWEALTQDNNPQHDFIEFFGEDSKLEFMKNIGLKVTPYKVGNLDYIKKLRQFYVEKRRPDLDYEIDGLVIKVNELDLQKKLGEVDNRPKGQIAWKFDSEGAETIVKEITWEVGRTGRVTPVSHVEPIEVGGVTVSKASLYNYSYIKELGIVIGAKVFVVRAGDVIPRLEKVLSTPPMSKCVPTIPPSKCPKCNSKLAKEGEYLECRNLDCPSRVLGDLSKWIEVTEIEECGPAFLQDVVDANLVSEVTDLYLLRKEDLLKLPGYKSKKAQKIIDQIQSKKKLPLTSFFAALNIPNVSTATFAAIEEDGHANYDEMLGIITNPLLETKEIEGIGEKTAKQLRDGVMSKLNLMNRLLQVGVEIIDKKTGKLSGTSFCFTGALEIKRGDAVKLVEDMGGVVKTSVSKNLNYLVQSNPNSQSTKSQKARKYGTKIIDEDAFMDLVEFDFKKLLR